LESALGDAGAHASRDSIPLVRESRFAPVPSAFITRIEFVRGASTPLKAIWRPSGDQTGPLAQTAVFVKRVRPVPSGFAEKIAHRPPVNDAGCLLNRIRLPSGDHAGKMSNWSLPPAVIVEV